MMLNISPKTVQAWEQGLREVSYPAPGLRGQLSLNLETTRRYNTTHESG
jgi:hypothetical protein